MADSVGLHQSASQGPIEQPVARNSGSIISESLTHKFPNHSLNLLEQLDLQRHHKAYTDITVRVTSADDSQVPTDFRLHKCLLAALSSKFQLLIFSAISSNTDLITLNDVTPRGVAAIINYIYTGSLKLDSISAQDVLVAARWLEMSEVVKVVVDFIEKVGPDPQMPPTEAALSLMRMSQGIGLGGSAMAQGQMGPEPLVTPIPEPVTTQTINSISSSVFNPSSPTNQSTIRLPPIAWVSQGPRFHQGGAGGLYPSIPIDSASIEDYLKSMETSLAQTSANISPRGGIKTQTSSAPPPVTDPRVSISPGFTSATSPLAVQISESDIPEKDITSPIPREASTPLPLAILSPDGQTAVQILNTPSATTTVTSGGDIEEESTPGPISKTNTKVGRRISKDGGNNDRGRSARKRTSVKKETEVKTTAQAPAEDKAVLDNLSPDPESPGMASKEIAIQTSIASYTVRMKKKKVLRGKRKRGRPRKRKLDENETEAVVTEDSNALATAMDSSEIKKRPLKKRLKEEAVEEPKLKPKQKASEQKTLKIVPKKKPGRQKLSTSGEKKVHTCPKCSRQFGKRGAVRRHLEMHEKGTMYACHVCGFSYPRASELTQHMRKHAENKWVCTECDSDFTDPRIFKKHMASLHQDQRPFRCQFEGCEFRSSRPSNVDKHGVIHSGVKSFTCTQCGKSFAQPNGLQSHLKSCFQKRNYVCDLCGQRFNYLQSMKCHRLLHTGEKPHECTKCGARFADHRNYKRHKRIHDHGGVPKSSAGRRIRDLSSEEVQEEQVPHPQAQHTPQPLPPPTTQQLPQQQQQLQQQLQPQLQHLPPPPPHPQVLFQSANQMPTERTNVAIVQMNNGIIQPIPASTTQLQPVLPFRNDQINLVSGAPVSISQTLTTALQPPQANRYIEAIINANTGQTQGQSLTQTIVHHIAPMNQAEEQPELVPQMTQPMTTWTHVPFTRSFENL